MTILMKAVSFIATCQPKNSRHFYETILGFECVSDDPFALVFDLNNVTLRIQKVESLPSVNHTVLGWEVPNIRESAEALTQKGVRFESFAQLAQDELGVWASPSGASIAWLKDPDGNTLSLTQLSTPE